MSRQMLSMKGIMIPEYWKNLSGFRRSYAVKTRWNISFGADNLILWGDTITLDHQLSNFIVEGYKDDSYLYVATKRTIYTRL